MIRPILDDRHRRILRFVVESHVQSAEPVGSQTVRAAYHLSISPATIRGAMSRLEEAGLLHHPHTSAGRLPTESGYRYYVDELMQPAPVPAATRRAVDSAFEAARRLGQEPGTGAARTLARLARLLAVVAVWPGRSTPVVRLELVALEDGLFLLAVGSAGGPLASATWKPAAGTELLRAPRVERWIRARLPVPGAAGLRALAAIASREAPGDLRPCLGQALIRAAQLIESQDRPAFRIEGADHIASQPEFQSTLRLRALVSLLAEREPLTRALDSFAESDRPRVSIGREIGLGPIRGCSLVGRGIEIRGHRGSVGVLGPVRMPYRRLVSLVAYLGERLEGCA